MAIVAAPPRIVLLPGMDGTGTLSGPLLRALPSGLAVSVVSYPADSGGSYAELLPLARAAVAAGPGPCAIVAESFSGPLAILLAAERPPGLAALVLVATFARRPLPAFLPWRTLLRGLPLSAPAPLFLVRRCLTGSDTPPELADAVRRAIRGVRPEVLRRRMRAALDVDVAAAAATLRLPVLRLAASRDRLLGGRGWQGVAAPGAPAASVTLDGPHLLLQAKPRESAAAIMGFLRSAMEWPVA